MVAGGDERMWIFAALCYLHCVWIIVDANGAPTIQPFSFSNSDVSFGRTIKTLCTATGREPLSFQWNKDGLPLHNNSHTIKIHTHHDFSIVSLTPVDYNSPGNYTCIVKNSEGYASYTAQLLIQAPPKWLKEPQDSSVGLEGQISLDCEVRGHPRPTISWFKLNGEDRTQLKSPWQRHEVAENGSLIIRNVKPEDAAIYECKAANEIGVAISKKIALSVHVPAHFRNKLKVENVAWGETAILRCEAIGDNPISIAWTKNEAPISEKESSRYEVYHSSTETGATSELHIQVTDREDNGLFVCIAKNAFGKDERTLKLVVLEVPGPPSDVRVEQTWSQSASLRWNVPYGGNSPITSFITQFWRDAGAPHKLEEEKTSASQTFTMLKDLQPGTSYVVRVLAENEVGRGNPSESQQFLTKEAEPSSPPTDVNVEARGAGTLRVKWKTPPRDQWNGLLKGYYIGYKVSSSSDPYSFKTVEFSKQDEEYCLTNLLRATGYSVIVQAFNSAGSGPPSQEAVAETSSIDPPSAPFLWVDFQSRSSIGLKWKPKISTLENNTSPVDYYTLYYKDEYGPWSEIAVPKSAEKTYLLSGVREGTRYQIYMKSSSEAGDSDPSDMLTLKTEGGALSDMSSHPVIDRGDEEIPIYLHPSVLIPLASSISVILLVIVGACIYVRKVEKHYKAAVPDGRSYSYCGSSTLPHSQQRYKDALRPPLLRVPLPPHPPPEGYPLPYATMPIRNGVTTVEKCRPTERAIFVGHMLHATVDRKRMATEGLTIQETAEVHHHYDMAA